MQTSETSELQSLVKKEVDSSEEHKAEVTTNDGSTTKEELKKAENSKANLPLAEVGKLMEAGHIEEPVDHITEEDVKELKPSSSKGQKKRPLKKVIVEKTEIQKDSDQNGSLLKETGPIQKKKKPRKRITFSSRKKAKNTISTEHSNTTLGKRQPNCLEIEEPEKKQETRKAPLVGKVMRNDKLIDEYRKKLLSEANKEYIGKDMTTEEPLKPQKIQFNPLLKVLNFAKLVRRSLADRLSKPEISTKNCQFKSALKGSSSTFNSTVAFSDISMFPNKNEIFEHELIDHELKYG